MAFTCVNKCSNGSYWLNKWKKQMCDGCGCYHKDNQCTCDPPFRLFPFPTKKSNPEMRAKWKQIVGRKQGSKTWSPSKDSRVCSKHFVDGKPSANNPMPTVEMGYEEAEKRIRRMQLFQSTKPEIKKRVRKVHLKEKDAKPVESEHIPIFEDPPVEVLQPAPQNIHQVSLIIVFWAMILWLKKSVSIKRMK